MELRVFVGAATDRGRVRKNNEDYYGLVGGDGQPGAGFVGVVADGVGGAEAGEEASRAAVETFLATFSAASTDDPVARLRAAVEAANATVFEAGALDHRGTTLVAATVVGDRLHVVNVGDSRLYHARGPIIRQVTLDHNWVAEQVRAGALSPDAVRTHPYRNVITRSLGTESVEPDFFEVPVTAGDRVILCSDGLIRHVGDATIGEVAGRLPEQAAAEELVRLAVAGGGSDNVTVMVVRFAEEDATGGRSVGDGATPRPARAGKAPKKDAARPAGMRRRGFGAAIAFFVALALLAAAGTLGIRLAAGFDSSFAVPDGPTALAVAGDGTLYLAARDTGEVLVCRPDATGALSTRLLGAPPAPSARWTVGEPGSPGQVVDIAVSSTGRVVVLDGGGRVRVFSSAGEALGDWGVAGPEVGHLDQPTAIAAAGDERVYVVDAGKSRVQAFSFDGSPLWALGTKGAATTVPAQVGAITVDSTGNLYVADAATAEVRRYSPIGEELGRWVVGGDRAAISLAGLAIGPDGRVWVADVGQHSVYKLDDAGGPVEVRTTLNPTGAALGQPDEIGVDAAGEAYVLDRAARAVHELAPAR